MRKLTKEQLEEFETALQRYIFENVDLDEFFEDEFRKLEGNWSLRTYHHENIKIGINVKYYGYENYEKIKELFPTITDDIYFDLMQCEIEGFFDLWKEWFKNEFGINLLCFGRSGGYFGFEINDLSDFGYILQLNSGKLRELFDRLIVDDDYYEILYNTHDEIIDDIFNCLELQDKFMNMLNDFITDIFFTREYWKSDDFCKQFVDEHFLNILSVNEN
jgi:hypothetical protein